MRSRAVATDNSREPLLSDEDPEDQHQHLKDIDDHQAAVSLVQLFTAHELRRPLIIVCFSMLTQQLSGR